MGRLCTFLHAAWRCNVALMMQTFISFALPDDSPSLEHEDVFL